MYKLKLIELYYLLEAKLAGEVITRQQIKDLLPELAIGLKTIEQLEKENTALRAKNNRMIIQSNKVITKNKGLISFIRFLDESKRLSEEEINNLKKNIEL